MIYSTGTWIRPVVRVFAQGSESTDRYRGQKDSYTAVMNHANGAVSVLSQSVVCHSGQHDQFIMGSLGSMMFTHGSPVAQRRGSGD